MVGQPPFGEALGRGKRRLLVLAASAALSAGTAALILTRHRLLATIPALGASAALLVAAFGARAEGVDWMDPASRVEPTRHAERFADGTLDRVFDACVLVPLAWVTRSGSNVDAFLALVGLGASYVASYERARGEALGYRGTENLAYRATRYATLVFGLLTGWLEAALWAFVVLTVAAAAVRAWNVAAQERRSPSPRGTTG